MMAPRGIDVIGQGLLRGIPGLAQGWNQYETEEKRKRQVADLIKGLLQGQSSTNYAPQGGVQNADGSLNPLVGSGGTPMFSMENFEALGRLGELSPQSLAALQMTQPQPQIIPGFRGGMDVATKFPWGGVGIENFRPPMAEQPDSSGSGQAWSDVIDPKTGMPETGKLNGVAVKRQERWIPNPQTGKIELKNQWVRLDASSGGGFPAIQLVPTDAGYIGFDKRKAAFVPIPGEPVYKLTPTEMKSQLMNLQGNKSSITEIKSIVDREGVTGPVVGRARQFGTKFFSDAAATKLKARLAQLRTVIYGLSGKQINESEQEWLKNEVLPNMTNPTTNFEVTLDEFEKWIDRRMGEIQGQFPGSKMGQETQKQKDPSEMSDEELKRELGLP